MDRLNLGFGVIGLGFSIFFSTIALAQTPEEPRQTPEPAPATETGAIEASASTATPSESGPAAAPTEGNGGVKPLTASPATPALSTPVPSSIQAASQALASVSAMPVSEIADFGDQSLESLLRVRVGVGTNFRGAEARDIPASLFTISRRDIQLTGSRSLAELLSTLVPGFMSLTDEDSYIFGVRGLVQDCNWGVSLLVNGQNVGYTYNYGLDAQANMLDLNHIERVEVITGPGSSELGLGPLMGVINIVTNDFTDSSPDQGRMEGGVRLGSGGYRDLYARARVQNGDFKLSLTASQFEQPGGYSPKAGNEKWTVPESVLKDGKYFDQRPGHALYGLAQYKKTTLSFYSNRNTYDAYVVGEGVFQSFEGMGASLRSEFSLSDKILIHPEIHANRVGMTNRVRTKDIGNYGLEGEDSIGGRLSAQIEMGKLRVALGGDMDHYWYGPNPWWQVNSYSTAGFPTLSNQSQTEIIPAPPYSTFQKEMTSLDFGGFLEGHYTIVPKRHFVVGSMRLSHNGVHPGNDISPRIAYLGRSGAWDWKLFYTKAFRIPLPASQPDLPAGAFWRHYYNPGLNNQTIHNFEVNVRYTRPTIGAELRAFYAFNRDIIQGGGSELAASDPNDTRRSNFWWTYANAGNMDSAGGELIADFNPMPWLKMRASHALVKVVRMDLDLDVDLFVSKSQKRFLNYPENVTRGHFTVNAVKNLFFRVDLLVDYGRLQGDPLYTGSGHSGEAGKGASNQTTDPWININCGAIYRLPGALLNGFELFAHAYNILNSRPYWPVVFKNDLAVTPPGFSFMAGLKWNTGEKN